jgi:hypothetical protein
LRQNLTYLAQYMAAVSPPSASELELNRQLFLPAANGETRAGEKTPVSPQ